MAVAEAESILTPGGPGVSFPNTPPAGMSLQLGALGIVLALLSLAETNLLPTAARGIVVPVAFSIGAVAIFTGGIMNFRAGIMVAGVIGVLYGMF
jgi:succinate-acetate transporter protein